MRKGNKHKKGDGIKFAITFLLNLLCKLNCLLEKVQIVIH